MTSEARRLSDRYDAFSHQYRAHETRLQSYIAADDYNSARGCVNDLIDFWNQAQECLGQFQRRVGRPLKMKNDGSNSECYRELVEWNQVYNLGRSISPEGPYSVS